MFIIRSSAAPGPPSPALMEAMHAMATREIAAGRMIDDGGLMPLDMGARITNARGTVAVIDGPFAETKEVIGGYAVFEVATREEAVQLGKDFMQLHIDHMPGWDGVMEMREVAGSMTRPL
ncbi:MAG TPA: YciI family protein [Phenylobacterium sp.]